MANWVMTSEEMEAAAATHAGALRVGGYMVVFIGYLYIGLVLAGVLGVGFGIAVLLLRLQFPEFIIVVVPSVLYLFVSVARACWYVFPASDAIPLTRGDAPALFSMIDDIAAEFNTTVHRVLINREFGASARSTRRFGIPGWRRNEIVMGYAKLCAHDVGDIRSTLAHEVAHIANAHTRKDFGLVRAMIAAGSLRHRLHERGHWAAPLFRGFLARQVRTLKWVTRILARQHERDADEAAGRIVGRLATRDALLRSIVRRRLTNRKFWPSVNARAAREAEPPTGVYSEALPAFLAQAHELDARAELRSELKVRTEWDDTHPSTLDRHFAALNTTPDAIDAFVDAWQLPPIGVAAVHTMLSADAAERLAKRFDTEWRTERSSSWKATYELATDARGRRAVLDGEMLERSLSPEEHAERACLINYLEGERVGEPLLRAALVEKPDHAGALFMLAESCLARDDEEGVSLMKRAIAAGPTHAVSGWNALAAYARRCGDLTSTATYDAGRHSAEARDAERDAERAALTPYSRFVPGILSPERVNAAIGPLPNERRVRRAWLAAVAVRHDPENPPHVLLLDTGWWWPGIGWRDDALVTRIAPECRFRGKGFVTTEHLCRRLRRRIKRAAGAPVYVRQRVNRLDESYRND